MLMDRIWLICAGRDVEVMAQHRNGWFLTKDHRLLRPTTYPWFQLDEANDGEDSSITIYKSAQLHAPAFKDIAHANTAHLIVQTLKEITTLISPYANESFQCVDVLTHLETILETADRGHAKP